MATSRSRSRSPRSASQSRRLEKVDSAPRNEDGKTKFDYEELKKITIEIICNPQKEGADLKRAIVNPELVAPVRRPDEGKKPIFDRAELRSGVRVLLDEEREEVPRRTRDRSRSKGRHYRSARPRKRSRERRERSRSTPEGRKVQNSRNDRGRRSRDRSRSRSRSRSRRGGKRRSSRERPARDRSRSDEENNEVYHKETLYLKVDHRSQGMMPWQNPVMEGFPHSGAMVPHMPIPPGYRPPFPPPFYPGY